MPTFTIPTITSLGQLQKQLNSIFASIVSAFSPGGTSGQVQYNNAGAFGGFTVSGDGTLVTSTGVLTVTKLNGVSPGLFFSGTDAANLTGTLSAARIASGSLALSKLTVAAASSKLVGSGASGSGSAYTEITLGTGLSMTGTTLSASGGSGTVTSVALTVPTFLSIGGSPITTSGTLAITLSGTALPVANGGTGQTSYTAHGVLLGEGSSGLGVTAALGAGQILVGVASADPVAGNPGWVLITETVTSSSAASVTFSSIPATYRDLRVVVRGRGDASAASVQPALQFNSDTAGNYDYQINQAFGSSSFFGNTFAATSILTGQLPAATATANFAGANEYVIYDYRGTTFDKCVTCQTGATLSTSGQNVGASISTGNWRNTAAINAVKVFLSSGNFVNGSVVSLYGSF